MGSFSIRMARLSSDAAREAKPRVRAPSARKGRTPPGYAGLVIADEWVRNRQLLTHPMG
jgi:hypothetical protein